MSNYNFRHNSVGSRSRQNKTFIPKSLYQLEQFQYESINDLISEETALQNELRTLRDGNKKIQSLYQKTMDQQYMKKIPGCQKTHKDQITLQKEQDQRIFDTIHDNDMARQIRGDYLLHNYQTDRNALKSEFLYQQKLQNRMKYTKHSQAIKKAVAVPKGTISIMLDINKNQKQSNFNVNDINLKMPANARFKLKWKVIQLLINNQKAKINQLCDLIHNMELTEEEKKVGLSRDEFGKLLSSVCLGGDKNFGDMLFYIFDADGGGTIDYQELIMGLEIFKDNSIKQKIQTFINLAEPDENNNLTQLEVYNILKQSLFSVGEKYKLKRTLQGIYKEIENLGILKNNKEILTQLATQNPILNQLIIGSISNVKKVDKIIEDDLVQPFSYWIPVSNNFVTYKEGIHQVQIDKLFNIIADNENLINNKNKLKMKLLENNKQLLDEYNPGNFEL